MERQKIIVASSKETLQEIEALLSFTGFHIIGNFPSGNETLRRIAVLLPDIVITDYTLTDMTGVELAQNVEHLKICPTVIIANPGQSDYVEEFKQDSFDIFCITKPLDKIVLNHTLSLIARLSKRMHYFECKAGELEQKLADRKLIEKAKGLLMEKFKMTEDQAYKHIKQKAMNASKTIAQISQGIVNTLIPTKNDKKI
jgi:response regulator NasT